MFELASDISGDRDTTPPPPPPPPVPPPKATNRVHSSAANISNSRLGGDDSVINNCHFSKDGGEMVAEKIVPAIETNGEN